MTNLIHICVCIHMQSFRFSRGVQGEPEGHGPALRADSARGAVPVAVIIIITTTIIITIIIIIIIIILALAIIIITIIIISSSSNISLRQCFDLAVSFSPLDMAGESISYESSALDCQQRCQRVEGISIIITMLLILIMMTTLIIVITRVIYI